MPYAFVIMPLAGQGNSSVARQEPAAFQDHLFRFVGQADRKRFRSVSDSCSDERRGEPIRRLDIVSYCGARHVAASNVDV